MRKRDFGVIGVVLLVLVGVVFVVNTMLLSENQKVPEDQQAKERTTQEKLQSLGENPNRQVLSAQQKQELLSKLGRSQAAGNLTQEQLRSFFPSVNFEELDNNQQLNNI